MAPRDRPKPGDINGFNGNDPKPAEQTGTGDNSGTWGTVLNGQAIDLVDEALDGLSVITISGDVTLSSTNYATDQARKRVLKLAGSPGASFTVTIPSVEKFYYVHNATNAAQTVKAAGAGVTLASGAIKGIYCDGTDCFGPADTLAAPVGTVLDFAGTTAPSGWLFSYGQDVSRTGYPLLFAALLTTYGVGNGSTTFTLPDFRGRVRIGRDNMGGGVIGRVTAAGSGIDGTALGASGGLQSHTLSIAEMPAHDHGGGGSTGSTTPTTNAAIYTSAQAVSFGSPVAVPTAPAGASVSAHTHTYTIPSQGGGTPFAMMPPGIVCNVIIYAGA